MIDAVINVILRFNCSIFQTKLSGPQLVWFIYNPGYSRPSLVLIIDILVNLLFDSIDNVRPSQLGQKTRFCTDCNSNYNIQPWD